MDAHLADPNIRLNEFDLTNNWQLTCECIQRALQEAKILPQQMAAISTCSMREGIVLYNENKHPIWACGNVDARATTEVNELKALNNYTFEQQLYNSSGQTLALNCATTFTLSCTSSPRYLSTN